MKTPKERLHHTSEGNFWESPRFTSDTAPIDIEIRKPYWTTGPHCPSKYMCGPVLTYEEIERYLGPEARAWAEADDKKPVRKHNPQTDGF